MQSALSLPLLHPIHTRSYPLFREIGYLLLAAAWVAFCSQIRISLPFTPVPFTCQTLAVLGIGAVMGSQRGAQALLVYCAAVLTGLPILSGWASDPTFLWSPRAGYVAGFIIQAFMMGWWIERQAASSFSYLLGGCCACMVQLAMGAAGLALFIGWQSAWQLGFFPFIPIELFKVCLLTLGFWLKGNLSR